MSAPQVTSVEDSRSGKPLIADPEMFTILRHLCAAAEVPFDPVRANIVLRKAQLEIPPTAPRAARQRLTQAAEALDLQILHRQLSTREALEVAVEQPLAIYTVTPAGIGRWYLLIEGGRRGRLLPLEPGDPDEALTADELAERLGAANADAVIEWLAAQPAAPMTEPLVHEPHEAEHHGPSPLARVIGLLKSEWRDIVVVAIYAIAVGLLSLAVPITAMAVVNTVALATLLQQLLVLCVILLVALILASLLRALQTIVVEYLQRRVFSNVVADLAYRLPRVQIQAFDRVHGPELVNRFFDVLTVQKSAATLLLDGITVVLQTSIGLLLLAAYHEMLLGFDLILIAALIFIIVVLGRGGIRTSIKESRAKYAVASWMEELARSPTAFKLGGGPRFARERADELTRAYLKARQDHFRIVMRQFTTGLLIQALANTALLAIGGYLVVDGQLTLGQLVAAELIVTLVVDSFTKFGKQLESYYDLMAAVEKLGHLLDLPLERSDGTLHREAGGGAHVKVHEVSFSYQDGHRRILESFNMELQPGERVALLGPNGAGKTTLIELLFGMREPESGYIQIDGADLRDLRLDSVRSHVAIVRGIEVFDGTILDNVRMGRDELSIADVRRALQAVQLLDEILDLPAGLQTRLTSGGRPLSLGQAERLMLARAIAGQPRLLVLDEVLDDMDRSVRDEVLPAIVGRDARWTLLVVTHSLEVASLCDRCITLSKRRPSSRAHESLQRS
jgi:ABC-type bacteriocin/lantibiotic exporter with double-glycine peptidase domain